jgi:hypothetical protein
MVTDQRTGLRTIRAARETFAAVALTGLTVATVFRCAAGRLGAFAGIILTVMAIAILSRYRVSWDADSVSVQTPFSLRRRIWTEISAYTLDPQRRSASGFDGPAPRRRFGFLDPCRLSLYCRGGEIIVNLKPYSLQDIRHLQDRVGTEVPLREASGVLVS